MIIQKPAKKPVILLRGLESRQVCEIMLFCKNTKLGLYLLPLF